MRTPLDDDVRKAQEMGLSYGRWRALSFDPSRPEETQHHQEHPARRTRKRKYTDLQAFQLWQQGHTDAEIAAAFGVSRALIQRWRDTLELPSTSKTHIDTQKYHLAKLPDGTSVVLTDDGEI